MFDALVVLVTISIPEHKRVAWGEGLGLVTQSDGYRFVGYLGYTTQEILIGDNSPTSKNNIGDMLIIIVTNAPTPLLPINLYAVVGWFTKGYIPDKSFATSFGIDDKDIAIILA